MSVFCDNLKGILPMIWSFNSYLLLLFWKRKELRFETIPICFYFEQRLRIYYWAPKRKTCNFRFDVEVFCSQKSKIETNLNSMLISCVLIFIYIYMVIIFHILWFGFILWRFRTKPQQIILTIHVKARRKKRRQVLSH